MSRDRKIQRIYDRQSCLQISFVIFVKYRLEFINRLPKIFAKYFADALFNEVISVY